ISSAKIKELFIDGGATAEAVLHKLQWGTFDVIAEYGPGVVQMRVSEGPDNYVTIKPGSYPWPDRIWM
ncbi:MAG TPA: four-carbon acid sugar kinase family protein, partial [Dehalococcoidia bacterium]|nr:four-carbon acid sugar kinase family protein [Dehalococcoidia bacterium]